MKDHVLAIDLGATKIAIGLVSREGEVTTRLDISSKANSLSELNERLADAIDHVVELSDGSIIGIGIGSAGPINPKLGTINPINIELWDKFPLVDFVRERVGISNIRLIGDASALTYAEFILGAGRAARNLMGVVVSTGIGGGTVLNGKFFPGVSGNSGFIGHTTIDIDGEMCSCGAIGCVETFASGPNMSRWSYGQGLKLEQPDDFIEVAELARNGNPIALAAIQRGAHALAIAFVNAVATMDLDTIVVGGGVINAADIYWEPLEDEFAKRLKLLGFGESCKLFKATLGHDSGLVGAGLVGFIEANNYESERK